MQQTHNNSTFTQPQTIRMQSPENITIEQLKR